MTIPSQTQAQTQDTRPIDPVLLSIVQKQLDHITRQMGLVMTRTASSPIFSQSHDFSCFIGTPSGDVAAQADGLPIHSAAGGFAFRAVLQKYGNDMSDGDVFLLSDPYVAGGNHLPDWTMVRPVYAGDRLSGLVGNRAHQSDIGGGAAGTYNPAATEIFHEGIRLPVMRFVEKGKMRGDLLELLMLNSRCPDLLEGDLGAMLGSLKIGAARLEELMQELGGEQAERTIDALLDYGERCMRAEIATLPDGTYYGEDGSDTDCFESVEVPIKVKVTVSNGTLDFDFTGSSPQIRGFKNSSLANTYSSVHVAVAAFFGPSLPRNSGAFRSVSIVAPLGSVVNARPPAPMTMNTTFPATDMIMACWKALADADPARACAGWGKPVYGVSSGRRADGTVFVMYHWHASPASGAVAGRDGLIQAGNMPSLGGRTNPNVEGYERIYPCRVLRHEMRCDAAGAGEFRGGTSCDYEADILVDSEHAVRAEGMNRPSGFGVLGGQYGRRGTLRVRELDGEELSVPQYGMQRLRPARFTIEGTAGGGWGDPCKRDPERVLRDVRDGVVSRTAAQEVYGVVLSVDGRAVDSEGTKRLRAKVAGA